MKAAQIAALLFSGLFAVATPSGEDGVTALTESAPAYLVEASAYSTSTLYTTSYFVITECAPNASGCPTNGLTVVTSVVFASSTTTVCLTTEMPQAALPSATGALPSSVATTTDNPSSIGTVTSPSASYGQLPSVASSDIPIGPGPVLQTNPIPSIPSSSVFSSPSASISVASSISGSSEAPSSTASVSIPGISDSHPGASSYNPLPGVPPRPHPSSGGSSLPAPDNSHNSGPDTKTTATIPSLSYPGIVPTPGSGTSSSGPILSYLGPTPIPGSGILSTQKWSTSVPDSSGSSFWWASLVPGSNYDSPVTSTRLSTSEGPSGAPGSGSSTASSSLNSDSPYSPSAPGNIPQFTGPSPNAPKTTSSTIESTLITHLTSTITYPHTTLVITIPVQNSTRNYSTETLGLHTSIGTDASAYIPTGSGWWPSATNNGTIVFPTPSSPIPVNNEAPQAFSTGKSAFIAIVGALAFAHFV